MEPHSVYKPVLRPGLMLSRRWPTENEFHGIFGGSFSHDVFGGLFSLQVFRIYIIVSGFMSLWYFLVCE